MRACVQGDAETRSRSSTMPPWLHWPSQAVQRQPTSSRCRAGRKGAVGYEGEGQNLSAVLAAAGLDSAAQIVPGRDGLRGVEVHDNEPGYRGRYYLRGYA